MPFVLYIVVNIFCRYLRMVVLRNWLPRELWDPMLPPNILACRTFLLSHSWLRHAKFVACLRPADGFDYVRHSNWYEGFVWNDLHHHDETWCESARRTKNLDKGNLKNSFKNQFPRSNGREFWCGDNGSKLTYRKVSIFETIVSPSNDEK